MVYFSIMKRAKVAAMAALLVSALAGAASAQADLAWNALPETRTAPVTFRPGAPLPEFTGGSWPSRPSLYLEDSSEDRELRLESLSKCGLLSEIRGRTILDVVAGVPNDMIDLFAAGLTPPPARDESCSVLPEGDCSVLTRVFAHSLQKASDRPFDDLVHQLLLREQRYFARFQDSDLSTVAVEDGVEDIDADGLMSDQRKLLFDAARRLYFGRFGNCDDRIRDESLDIRNWQAIDYAVAPSLIAGYLYVRGWEKKAKLLGLNCTFQIEPIRRILERLEGSHDDLVAAASVELGLGRFPLKAIVSFGIQDGDPLVDFVGIGTSVGKAKQVVEQAMGDDATD
jgi:hypothetical protein